MPALAQRLRQLFHALARLAVDDAGVALVLALDEAQQLVVASFFSTMV
jgi:hypothetical protein